MIKVSCTVTNSAGEIAYDIYEFYLNDSPFVGTMDVSLVGELSNSTGTAVNSLFHITLTKWYDSPDDSYQKLKLKVYVIKAIKVGNTIQTQQYTITD